MALCRCKEMHANPEGRTNPYVVSFKPIGYPNTSSICGRTNCENNGLIWLTQNELDLYNQGIRIFKYSNNNSKVKVI